MLPYKAVFLAAVLGMLMVASADTGLAWILQPIMDQGFVERDARFIKLLPVLLIGIGVVRAVGDFVDGYCINWVARRVIQDLRQKMFDELVHASTEFYDQNSIGGLVSRLTYDVEQVARASSEAFRTLFKDLIKSCFLLGLMLYLSWKLSMVFILVIPLVLVIFKSTSGRFREISSRIQESVGDIAHISKQAFQGHRLVKGFSAYDHEKQAFFTVNNRNRQQSMKKIGVLMASVPLVVLILGICLAGVIWLALLLEIKPGVFTSYLVSITMIVQPVRNLSKINEVIQTGMAGAESIFRTIDLDKEPDNGTLELDKVIGNVSFKHVSFSYAGGATQVLQDISFDIKAGSTVALVGPSGSGKSTVASILMRFHDPTSGAVTVDGTSITEISLKSLRNNVAFVSQEVMLFDDTIRNNITYGLAERVDEEKLQMVCEVAYVTEFINSLEDGMDTMVGEAGGKLSGGQRQRIAIARALLKDAVILVLDEATSALDSSSEQHIQHAIEGLIHNRTTLVIAHRLSTIENAGLILVLDKGRIAERGTHQELIRAKGQYYHLYHTQYKNSEENAR